ncbi:hypothetical protein [Acidomonas methanolica]|uniref:Uncharacterized protein n=1 Tax=Acidomonas methanolica NBRC 104435 TaxID=1231351 RepID=A0A023D8N0_ACIMT|nr:hypothetical protein [Acidomonas methanolica]MBU2655234.1 hypothetical protein [Acidomonas methanolica]TCS25595.1 hypothetical protein EDC31_11828 [Acidomonas methanolica]GAJ30146.1 hypothetical protein Amme_107_005 [Acidomonas methanolica NBRC 104435]GEK98720.1 hypothetical protein AME01nite_12190 [Acidomonas methanolica NBRC 104435]
MPKLTRRSARPRLALEGGSGNRPSHRLSRRPPDLVSAQPQPDLFDHVAESGRAEERTHLSPLEVPVTLVSLAALGSGLRPDAWLYCLCPVPQSRRLLRDGLRLDRRAPLSLLERPALFALVAMLAEAGEACPSILRLRRALVQDFLEPDPDSSARAGAPCYWLVPAEN